MNIKDLPKEILEKLQTTDIEMAREEDKCGPIFKETLSMMMGMWTDQKRSYLEILFARNAFMLGYKVGLNEGAAKTASGVMEILKQGSTWNKKS